MRGVLNTMASALLCAAVSLTCLAGAATPAARPMAAPDGVQISEPCDDDGCVPQASVSPSALADVDSLKGLTMGQAGRRLSERHPTWKIEWWLADRLADDGSTPYARTMNASDIAMDTTGDPLRVEHAALQAQPDDGTWIVTARVTVGNRATDAERETDWQHRKARAACGDHMRERYPWGVDADDRSASVTGTPDIGWVVTGRMDVTNKYNATARDRSYECHVNHDGTGFRVTAFTAPGDWDEDTAR